MVYIIYYCVYIRSARLLLLKQIRCMRHLTQCLLTSELSGLSSKIVYAIRVKLPATTIIWSCSGLMAKDKTTVFALRKS